MVTIVLFCRNANTSSKRFTQIKQNDLILNLTPEKKLQHSRIE